MSMILLQSTSTDQVSWWIDGLAGWADLPGRTLAQTPVPGRVGPIVTRLQETGRELTIAGTLSPLSGLHTDRQAAEDALRQLLAQGLVTVTVRDAASGIDRAIDGVCTSLTVRPVAHARPLRAYGLAIDARLVCPDSCWRETNLQLVAFGAAPTAMPLGTAPVAPLVRLCGPATNPILRYRLGGGPVLRNCTFTVTLGSADWLEVDCSSYRIEQVASGTRSSAYAVYSGDDLPVLEPGHGLGTRGPTLEVTSGTALAIYERRWR